MDIKEVSKSIGTQISIFALIAIVVFMYFKEDLYKLLERYEKIQTKELQLTKKEMLLDKKSEQWAHFESLMQTYINDYGHVDFSKIEQCDNERMKKLRQAKVALKALEGAAKTIDVFENYADFFQSQMTGMRTYTQC